MFADQIYSEITCGLLDQVRASGEMDVIRDLAYPLPVTVIAELLGIPAERREDFKQWFDALVSGDEETQAPFSRFFQKEKKVKKKCWLFTTETARKERIKEYGKAPPSFASGTGPGRSIDRACHPESSG